MSKQRLKEVSTLRQDMLSSGLLIYLHLTREEFESQSTIDFEEIKFQRKTDWRGESDTDTWPELTEKMNSIIKDEIAKLRKILEGVDGAEFREDFRNKARQVLSKEQSQSRRTALLNKAEQGLPSKDHHTVKVLFATTHLESSPIRGEDSSGNHSDKRVHPQSPSVCCRSPSHRCLVFRLAGIHGQSASSHLSAHGCRQ
jgi:hypothetical protein